LGGLFGSKRNNSTITKEAHFSLTHRCANSGLLRHLPVQLPAVHPALYSNGRATECHSAGAGRREIVEEMTSEDMAEMEAAVTAALRATEGEGWTVLRAGGAARGRSSHDCDFVITCRGSNRHAAVCSPRL